MILYISGDDGTIYPEADVDPSSREHYQRIDVQDTFTLTAQQVCYGYGKVAEVLLRAGVARIVDETAPSV